MTTSHARIPFDRFVAPVPDDEGPPIDRPQHRFSYRILIAALGLAVVVLTVQISARVDVENAARSGSIRLAALIIGVAYVCFHYVFAMWTHRNRVIIDDLRWRSFRRNTWSGWWATAWSATTLIAGALFALITVASNDANAAIVVGAILLVVRPMMLRALGANMARVVFRARRWLVVWGSLTAVADLFVFSIVMKAFVDLDPQRESLALVTSWAPIALVVVGLFHLAHMKRVERWILEWWDNRYGVTEQDVYNALSMVRPNSGMPGSFASRRLLSLLPLEFAVMVTYWFVAAAAIYSGWSIWLIRDELTPVTATSETFDRIVDTSMPFVVAVVVLQLVQGIWTVAQAWNAKRCTLRAPHPLGMLFLFLLGPAVLSVGLAFFPNWSLAFASLALLVNLACWASSFGTLSQTIQILGRSAQPIVLWSSVVSLHWVLGFVTRPLVLIDDPDVLAGSALAVAVFDGLVFFVASIYAWRAMRSMTAATRDYEQVRRINV